MGEGEGEGESKGCGTGGVFPASPADRGKDPPPDMGDTGAHTAPSAQNRFVVLRFSGVRFPWLLATGRDAGDESARKGNDAAVCRWVGECPRTVGLGPV